MAGSSRRRYKVEIPSAARRQIRRLSRSDFERIEPVIISLQNDPRPLGTTKLQGTANLWRIRVGNLRIVSKIRDSESLVTVLRVSKRDERTYRGL